MTNNPGKTQPSHTIYIVEGEAESAFWTKIGSAWAQKDGEGFNLSLIAFPVTGRLVIRKRKPKQQEGQGE